MKRMNLINKMSNGEGGSVNRDERLESCPIGLEGFDDDNDGNDFPTDAEYLQLMKSFNDESTQLPFQIEKTFKKQIFESDHLDLKNHSFTSRVYYEHPLSEMEANEYVMSLPAISDQNKNGLYWNATLIPDYFLADNKRLRRGLNPRDFHEENCTIKPRRPSLPVTIRDFFASFNPCRSSFGITVHFSRNTQRMAFSKDNGIDFDRGASGSNLVDYDMDNGKGRQTRKRSHCVL